MGLQMARKSFVELSAELLVDFPDQNTKAITPAILRGFFNALFEAIRPSYGYIDLTSWAVSLGLSDIPMVFQAGFVSDVPDYTTVPGTGTVTRVAGGTTRLTFNADVEGPTGRVITFTLYINGVATLWRTSVVAQGNGKPISVSLPIIYYLNAPATFQMQAKADQSTTAVTITEAILVAETVPVNNYT